MNILDPVELCGAIHLHTIYSDGGVNFESLIDAANQVELDFIVVTDHMSLKGRDNGFEGFHNNVFVLIGYEHQDSNNHNHYLVLGTEQVFDYFGCPSEYVNAVKKVGGIGFIAHPAEKRNYFDQLPPYPWTEWQVNDFDGIEIWNQMSDWMEQLTSWTRIVRLVFPRRFIGNITPELLKKWDELNKTRFFAGIGGVDAHTRKLKFGPFHWTVFPIKVELKGIRTHILLSESLPRDSVEQSKRIILSALKNGRSFISNFRWGDAKSSRFEIEYSNLVQSLPGYHVSGTLPALIRAKIPEKATIRLIKNSNLEAEIIGKTAEFRINESGIYRIEVCKKSNTWIYTNPFPVQNFQAD